MISLGAGLIYRNISDYDQQDVLFRSNITDSEVRYRRLERELPEFIIQNDRIMDILQKANDTFVTDTTYQLSNVQIFIPDLITLNESSFPFLARINKVLQTIDPVSRTSDNKYQSAINKTLIMQGRIDSLRETLKNLQKSYDDSLNQSQISEVLVNTKLATSEGLIRDQLENNMKQRFVHLSFALISLSFL